MSTQEIIADYARDRLHLEVTDLVDDPMWLTDNYAEAREYFVSRRRLAKALGMDFDDMVQAAGTEFEVARLGRIEAELIMKGTDT